MEDHEMKSENLKGSFAELVFENTAVKALPVEENAGNKTHQVSGYNFSRVKPTPRDNPRIVALSAPALELIDLDINKVKSNPETPLYLAGNKQMPGSDPVSQCYCGHQFGSFAGQLGDGRAITLGDVRNQKGELWELQFKGSGLTPYSRFADGKAVLRSSIREFLCSEALWALGIPTTRAASLVVSDTLAERDPLYTGRKIMEKCAVVIRMAPCLWRFGSFEIFKQTDDQTGARGPSAGLEHDMLLPMLDYLLQNHFSEQAKLEKEKNLSKDECYLEMYKEIVRRTAKLAALWQCYGFCHGVLNTDNMSILGLTIDFGPYGWMDYFDKGFICNHSDESGRYSYENQPSVCKWNLIKLAEALKSKLPLQKMKDYVNAEYDKIYNQHYYSKMRERLGLYCLEGQGDEQLIDDLFAVMHDNGSDFNNTFLKLSQIKVPKDGSTSSVTQEVLKTFVDLSPEKETLTTRYKPHYSESQLARIKQLCQMNPELLIMMGLSPSIVEQEETKAKQYKEVANIDENALKDKIKVRWEQWLKKYETRLLSETRAFGEIDEEAKDSELTVKTRFNTLEEIQTNRVEKMNKANPQYILRNYMAEEAIRKAEKEDFSGVNNLLKLMLNPFEKGEENYEGKEYTKCPPKWAAEICVSCSS